MTKIFVKFWPNDVTSEETAQIVSCHNKWRGNNIPKISKLNQKKKDSKKKIQKIHQKY